MKRHDHVDGDGDEVKAVKWGDGCGLTATIVGPTDEPDAQSYMAATIKHAHLFMGNLDAEDHRALALFHADAAAALDGES